MTSVLAQLVAWLSTGANILGRVLLAPVGVVPGWLSATLIAALSGVLLLAVFKYTSHQRGITRVRNDINANLLALKLFKDSARVSLKSQLAILHAAFWLFVFALVPILVMALPVTLLLSQIALWYQARPLQPGEEAVVTLKLNGDPTTDLPTVTLKPTDLVAVTVGPVRVRSKREVCWNVKAQKPGSHRLEFQVGDESRSKEFAIGNGLMRVSVERPGWDPSAILFNPEEEPFRPDDLVRSIEINYPHRSSWTSGTDSWVIYWFIVSMVAAVCFRRVLNVAA
jgi:hypothetical protein